MHHRDGCLEEVRFRTSVDAVARGGPKAGRARSAPYPGTPGSSRRVRDGDQREFRRGGGVHAGGGGIAHRATPDVFCATFARGSGSGDDVDDGVRAIDDGEKMRRRRRPARGHRTRRRPRSPPRASPKAPRGARGGEVVPRRTPSRRDANVDAACSAAETTAGAIAAAYDGQRRVVGGGRNTAPASLCLARVPTRRRPRRRGRRQKSPRGRRRRESRIYRRRRRRRDVRVRAARPPRVAASPRDADAPRGTSRGRARPTLVRYHRMRRGVRGRGAEGTGGGAEVTRVAQVEIGHIARSATVDRRWATRRTNRTKTA